MSALAQQHVERWRETVEDWHPTPSPLETAAYMVTEAAEVLDAVLRLDAPGHDRTNGHSLKAGLEREIGQTLDMLLTVANQHGVDAFCAMYDWMDEVTGRGTTTQAG